MFKHIPSGCINLKGGYSGEKKAIVNATKEAVEIFSKR